MLEGFAAEGQRAASRKRAEHHRADYAARLVGGLFHIEADKPLRALRTGLEDLLTAAAAVAHRRLLGNGIDAVRGADERRAVGGREAAEQRAARLDRKSTRLNSSHS